jgi:hypothetical protein
MEYPATDFYLKFKTIYNNEGYFSDFVLVYVSEMFNEIAKIQSEQLLGKSFSEIVVDNADKLYFKEIYLTMIPNKKFKFDTYIEELGRWYLINIFTDKGNEQDYVIVYYADITGIKNNIQQETASDNIRREIISLTDKTRHCNKDNLISYDDKRYSVEKLLELDVEVPSDCKTENFDAILKKTK